MEFATQWWHGQVSPQAEATGSGAGGECGGGEGGNTKAVSAACMAEELVPSDAARAMMQLVAMVAASSRCIPALAAALAISSSISSSPTEAGPTVTVGAPTPRAAAMASFDSSGGAMLSDDSS